jgi:hypothetical protein
LERARFLSCQPALLDNTWQTRVAFGPLQMFEYLVLEIDAVISVEVFSAKGWKEPLMDRSADFIFRCLPI